MLFQDVTQAIMWHFTLVMKWLLVCETSTHLEVQNPMWRFMSLFFFLLLLLLFLINVAFCLCEPVKIRLVFHSKFGLYTYTKTLQVTHRQLGVRTHTLRWTLPPICEANSFCHKWSQIGSAQSPITPHLG